MSRVTLSFSGCILKKPVLNDQGKLCRGAVILGNVDAFCKILPEVLQYFLIIEKLDWNGPNTSKLAHIKLVEDLSCLEATKASSPQAILLDIASADFVDTDLFVPLGNKKDYTGIQISNWASFKRHELFIQGVALLKDRKFIKYGHFLDQEYKHEIVLKNKIVSLSQEMGASIDFPYLEQNNNKAIDHSAIGMNKMINRCRMGILTTQGEGHNRFKMECLSANIPVLIPSDVSFPTHKHINEKTGVFFDPTPQGLAEAVMYVEQHYDTFKPREYVLEHTGIHRSVAKLSQALNECSRQAGENVCFDDISWDGRNVSQVWGEKIFWEINCAIEEIRCSRKNSRQILVNGVEAYGPVRESRFSRNSLGWIYIQARSSGLCRHYLLFFYNSSRLVRIPLKLLWLRVIKMHAFLRRLAKVFYCLFFEIPVLAFIQRQHDRKNFKGLNHG